MRICWQWVADWHLCGGPWLPGNHQTVWLSWACIFIMPFHNLCSFITRTLSGGDFHDHRFQFKKWLLHTAGLETACIVCWFCFYHMWCVCTPQPARHSREWFAALQPSWRESKLMFFWHLMSCMSWLLCCTFPWHCAKEPDPGHHLWIVMQANQDPGRFWLHQLRSLRMQKSQPV